METDPVSKKGRLSDRSGKKFKIMAAIAKKMSIGPTEIHESVYISDAELGDILTEMLRLGDVAYLTTNKGASALTLTAAGKAKYDRLAAKPRPSEG